MPRLKMIQTRSTGIDDINTGAARGKGIFVANVPEYGTVPVAKHVFALLLSILRKIKKADDSVRAGRWEPLGYQGTNISGKIFGVIGTGVIGSNVCRIAKGFGATVVAYDIFRREDLAREIGFSYLEFDELLRESDIISLHVPLMRGTYHMIDSNAVAKMKNGVVIINTTRDGIIDQKAIANAVKQGKIAGIGLDVYEQEPPARDDEIFELDNVVLTPHIAWNTLEAEKYILEVTLGTIRDFLEGRKP